LAVTYFEWAASSDQKIIIPWRVIDGPETADADKTYPLMTVAKEPGHRGERGGNR